MGHYNDLAEVIIFGGDYPAFINGLFMKRSLCSSCVNIQSANPFQLHSKHTIPRTSGIGNNCFALGVVQELCTHILLYWLWVLVGNYIWICLRYFWLEVGNNGIGLHHTFGLGVVKNH